MPLKVAYFCLGILLAAAFIILIVTISVKDEIWCSRDMNAGDCELYEHDDTCYCIDELHRQTANVEYYGTIQESCHKLGGQLATAKTNISLKWLAKRLYLLGIDDGLIGLRKFNSAWYWMEPEGPLEATDLLWRDDIEESPAHTHATIDVRSIITKSDDYNIGYIIYNYDFYIEYDSDFQWYGLVTTNLTTDNQNQRFYICQYTKENYESLRNIIDDKDNGLETERQETQSPNVETITVAITDPKQDAQCSSDCNEYELVDLLELDHSKTITSPGYPRGYCYNQKCGWLVKADRDLSIRLQWIAFNTEKQMDFVFIYDAETEDHSKLVDSCTGTACTNHVSSGPSMYIEFLSDHVTQDIGFKAVVTAVPTDPCYCTAVQVATLGSTEESFPFASPNFPNNNCENQNCKWIIKGLSSYGLQIQWDKFNLGPSSFVSLSENNILKTSCFDEKCDNIITDGPELEVHYESGSQSVGNVGFSALVKVVQNYCDKNDLNADFSIVYTNERDDGFIAIDGVATITCPENHKIMESQADVTDSVVCTSPHWSRQLGQCIPVCHLTFTTVKPGTEVVSICNFGDIQQTHKVPQWHNVTLERLSMLHKQHHSTLQYSCTAMGWLPKAPECTKQTEAILLMGGLAGFHDFNFDPPRFMILYIPSKNKLLLLDPHTLGISNGRTGHSSIVMPNGNVLVTGGKGTERNEHLSSSYIINLNLGNVSKAPDTNAIRYQSASTQLNGNAYVCGGYTDNGAKGLTDCEIYDGTKWSILPARLNTGRMRSQMVALNGSLYIMGGMDIDGSIGNGVIIKDTDDYGTLQTIDGMDGRWSKNIVERFSTDTGKWELVEPMNQRRIDFGAALLNNIIYACGGLTAAVNSDSLSSCEQYVSCGTGCDNEQNYVWKTIAPMNSKRYNFQLVALDGKLFAIGGQEVTHSRPASEDSELHVDYEPLQSVESYDPATNEWTIENLEMPLPIHSYTAVLLSVIDGIELLLGDSFL